MSIKLVAIDMDGTTFDNQGLISEQNLKAIRRANEMGVLVVPTTGRAFYEVPSQIYEIESCSYFVVSNGAVVCDREGNAFYTDLIHYKTAKTILQILEQYDVMPELYINGRPLADEEKRNYDSFRYYEIHPKYYSVLLEERQGVPDFYDYFRHKQMDVEKFNLFFKHLNEREAFIRRMRPYADEIELTSSMTNNLEINKRGANKGSGLAHLCCRLGIQPEEVLAMGDSENDLTMLRYAGTAVAVANAYHVLKQAADHITVSNDESAVAKVLEEFVFSA